MCLDLLPDDVLLHVSSYCDSKDIGSLQLTNRRLFNHTQLYPLFYKTEVQFLHIRSKKGDQYTVSLLANKRFLTKTIAVESLNNYILYELNSFDHDELTKMSELWWRHIKSMLLTSVIDYRRYLPHLDQCTTITLNCTSKINLTELLSSMETKNLRAFSLSSTVGIECTDDDLRKIARLSDKMTRLVLSDLTESSNVSLDAVLDMIEIGSYHSIVTLMIHKKNMLEDIRERLENRNWVAEYDIFEKFLFKVEDNNGSKYYVTLKNTAKY